MDKIKFYYISFIVFVTLNTKNYNYLNKVFSFTFKSRLYFEKSLFMLLNHLEDLSCYDVDLMIFDCNYIDVIPNIHFKHHKFVKNFKGCKKSYQGILNIQFVLVN